MKFLEFKSLMEYDRSKTEELLGNSIVKAAQRDTYLKSRNLSDTQLINAVVVRAEESDPTQNKQYVVWILRQFIKKSMKFEDMFKLRDDLETFVTTKGQHKRLGINSDINRYDWRSIVDIAKKLSSTELAEPDSDEAEPVENAKILYNGPLGILSVPQTEEASCRLGSGTRWCTAARNRNMFDYYNKQGPLYIWNDKKLKEKFQFHFESGQFKDEQDDTIDADTMAELMRNPIVNKLFIQNGPKVLASYIEYLDYVGNYDEDDDYEGPNEEIFDVDLSNILMTLPFEKAVKLIRPALMYSNEKTDYYNLLDALITRFIKKSELDRVESLSDHWVKSFERNVHIYRLARAPEQESVEYIKRIANSESAPDHAMRLSIRLKKTIPELEPIIARDGEAAYLYAYHTLNKQRFKSGEAAIAADSWAATYYVVNILKQRWPAAEPVIKQHPKNWETYKKALRDAN